MGYDGCARSHHGRTWHNPDGRGWGGGDDGRLGRLIGLRPNAHARRETQHCKRKNDPGEAHTDFPFWWERSGSETRGSYGGEPEVWRNPVHASHSGGDVTGAARCGHFTPWAGPYSTSPVPSPCCSGGVHMVQTGVERAFGP